MIGHNLVACCIRNFLRSQIGLSDNHHQLILMEPQTSQINSSQLQDENLTYLVRTAGNKRQSTEHLSKSLETLSSHGAGGPLRLMVIKHL